MDRYGSVVGFGRKMKKKDFKMVIDADGGRFAMEEQQYDVSMFTTKLHASDWDEVCLFELNFRRKIRPFSIQKSSVHLSLGSQRCCIVTSECKPGFSLKLFQKI